MQLTRVTLASLAFAAIALPAQSSTILTQWNFNANNLTPAIGLGTASNVDTTTGFPSGAGSSDPAATNQAWSTSGYPIQGSGNKTEGVQFLVSTLGMQDVRFSFDHRHSPTSSAYIQVQYTTNGTSFVDAASGLFRATAADTFFNGRSVDFTGVMGVDNNPSFGVRVVTAFAPGTSAYEPVANPNYGNAGTIRYDMVTFAAAPIPEPGTYALLLAGLGAVVFVARRRARCPVFDGDAGQGRLTNPAASGGAGTRQAPVRHLVGSLRL